MKPGTRTHGQCAFHPASGAEPYHRPHATDLEDAWNDLHDAKPDGWYVGRPSWDDRRKVWEQYAFDPRERARWAIGRGSGRRSRQPSSRSSARLARCLRLIREGRVPTERDAQRSAPLYARDVVGLPAVDCPRLAGGPASQRCSLPHPNVIRTRAGSTIVVFGDGRDTQMARTIAFVTHPTDPTRPWRGH